MTGGAKTYVARGEVCMLAGERAAIIFERIRYMAEQNALEGKNARDGRTWIVNSIPDWERYFPWLSYKQIRTALEKLRDLELLTVSQPNSGRGDMTFWYAVIDEAQDMAPHLPKTADAPSAQKGTSTSAQKGRPSAQKGTSIKDKTPLTDTKTPPQGMEADENSDFYEKYLSAHPNSVASPYGEKNFDALVASGVDPESIIASAKAYAVKAKGFSSHAMCQQSDNFLHPQWGKWTAFASQKSPAMTQDEKLDLLAGMISDGTPKHLLPRINYATAAALVASGRVESQRIEEVMS